jgi:type VI secretion system protein ImpA
MSIDVAQLLAPITEQDPCGPDLDYDPARTKLNEVFSVSFSEEARGGSGSGQTQDWDAVTSDILKLFTRTKDVALAVYLCRAAAFAQRLDVVEAGAETLHGLLETYWDSVHPIIEEANSPVRRTACESLARTRQFLGPLVRIPLLRHARLGPITGEDLIRANEAGEGEPEYARIKAIVADAGDAPLKDASERIARIGSALKAANAILLDRCGPEGCIDFQPISDLLLRLQKSLAPFVHGGEQLPSGDEAPAVAPADKAAISPSGAALRTRDDVVKAIDKICEYYRSREPASPIPLLMERAKSWVPMSFLEVLADISPDNLAEARRILEKKEST